VGVKSLIMRLFIAVAMAGFAGGCTIIRIEGAQKAHVTKFGILQIVPRADAKAIAYTSKGFGIVPTLRGATVGYSSETGVIQTDLEACHVVVFRLPEGPASKDVWEELLSSSRGICYVRGDANE
jgi:hypothetical protein